MEWLKKLLPQEDKFFVSIRALSKEAQNSATLLKEYNGCTDGVCATDLGARIAASKAEAKRISAQLTHDVAMSFVTPFEREDIQEFANHLYKIPKTIDKIRERLDMHDIKGLAGDLSRQIDLIVAEAAVMQEIVEALTHKGGAGGVADKVAILHDLETNGDAVLGTLLADLFRNTTDTRELILRKDIYDMLEKVLDRYRDAAAVALQIVLKHS